VFWTDGEWMESSDFWQSPTFLAWLYNNPAVNSTIVVNDRWGSDTRGVHGGFYTEEYSSTTVATHKWEENSGIDIGSYGFNRNTPSYDYLSTQYLLQLLVRSVCYGGNLLIDIGPNWDGRIPAIMQERLRDIGAWLSVNGEGIYSTSMWRMAEELDVSVPAVWDELVPNANNVYGLPPAPGQNASNCVFYGNTSNYQICQKFCGDDVTCASFTWHDNSCGNWSYGCYGRNDSVWSPESESGHWSGLKAHDLVSYTTILSNGNIYAIIDSWPKPGESITFDTPIPTLQTDITLVGDETGQSLKWNGTHGKPGITVFPPQLAPGDLPCDHLWTFRMKGVA